MEVSTARHSCLEGTVAKLEATAATCEKEVEQARIERDELSKERQMMLGYIQEMADKYFKLESKLAEQEKESKNEIERLSKEFQQGQQVVQDSVEARRRMRDELDKVKQVLAITEGALANERSINNGLRTEMANSEVNQSTSSQAIETLEQNLERITVEKEEVVKDYVKIQDERAQLRAIISVSVALEHKGWFLIVDRNKIIS